jgi:hypothetical protein
LSPERPQSLTGVAHVKMIDDRNERFDEVLALPARAYVLPQNGERIPGRDGLLIRPRRRERFVGVDDPHDLREEWHLVVAKAVGIPGAVEPLVMVTDDRADRL